MAPPPSTPASKFIFRRPPRGTTPHAASSPRFVTPRVAQAQAAGTPTPSQLFLTSSARRGYTDEIESSPPSSPGGASAGLEADGGGGGRERKRRRVSMSPGLDEGDRLADGSLTGRARVKGALIDDIESSVPSSPLVASGDVGRGDGESAVESSGEENRDGRSHTGRELRGGRVSISPDSGEQQHVAVGTESQDTIVDTDDDRPEPPSDDFPPDTPPQTRPPPRQPEFQAPPPFKPPDPQTEPHLEGLPPAFSPLRRGARYVPGGLAAEVQGWLSHIKGLRGAGTDLRIRVEGMRDGGRMYIVHGRTLGADGGAGGHGEEVRVLLAGEGEMTGLGESQRVTEGCVVEAGGLRWDVELDGLGRWTVACDWRVVGDSTS